jgi:GH24 family phage-related lysozyme (muramidase)
MKQPSPKALNLILEYEVGGGKSYYDKFLSHPTWPGGYSGMTLAIGIDCAYYTEDELQKMFYFLPEKQLDAVKRAVGKTGHEGQDYTKSIQGLNITVSWDQALNIFDKYTWVKYASLTEKTFPKVEDLCDNAYGALVSLVFNRGSSMNGDSRIEMRNIRDLVPKKDYKGIAQEIRKMKRLWEGKGLDGLLDRRDAEANLVESCA